MLENPLTGVGLRCFREAIGRDRDERGLLPFWQSAHNSLVQIGTETGVIGLTLFILMSCKAVLIFGRVRNRAKCNQLKRIGEMARLGFVGHFVSAFFLSQAYSLYWLFYVLLSVVLSRLLAEESKTDAKELSLGV
jgi:O-antigen ligase